MREMWKDTKLDDTKRKGKSDIFSCKTSLLNGDHIQNNWTQSSSLDFKESDILVFLHFEYALLCVEMKLLFYKTQVWID